MLLFVILLIVFSLPAVQTSVARKFTRSLKTDKDVDITIGKIGLSYGGQLKLMDVLVRDHHQDTLIYSQRITTSLSSFTSLLNNNPTLGNTTVENLDFNLVVYEGEDRDNLNILLNKLKSQKKKRSSSFILAADDLEVNGGTFSYINQNVEHPELLVLNELELEASNFFLENSEITATVEDLSAIEQRGLEIESLGTEFAYTEEAMTLNNFRIRTPGSRLYANILLDSRNGFSDFENTVPIRAEIDSASVSTDDLKVFYEGFGTGMQLDFKTVLEGRLNDFLLKNLKLEGLDRTHVSGEVRIRNAFAGDRGEFSLRSAPGELATNYYDLVNLLPGILQGKLSEELRSFGNVQLDGEVYLSEDSLVVDGLLFSQLGSAEIELSLSDYRNTSGADYKGKLQARQLNLGKLLDDATFGKTSFDISFNGQGLTAETLNAQVRGSVSEFAFRDYVYNHIKLRGTLKAPVFNGNLISLDPNLRMEFNGLADFSAGTNVYDFEASVAYADLPALNLVNRDSIGVFKGNIIMNMTGTNLNNAEGSLMLLNSSYQNEKDQYGFDDLKLTSTFEGPVRTIEVNSPDVINGTVEGVFDITEVQSLFENAVGSLYTNYRPNRITTDQYLSFEFDVYNKIVEVFFPQITLAPNTYIKGSVESDESEFRLTFRSPQINAFDAMLKEVNVQVDNSNPLFNTYIEIDSVGTDLYDISDFNLINVTLNDTLFVRSEFRGGPKNDDKYDLNLYHTINENNNSVVGFQRSNIKFKESTWHLNAESNRSNRLIFDDGFSDVHIDSLVLSHQEEEIRMTGKMRDSTYKNLEIQFDQVDLYKITPDIERLVLGGVVNGNLNLLQQNGAYYPNTSLTVKDLVVNEHLMGDLNLDVMGNEDLSFYNINTTLRKKGLESFSAIGEIEVVGEVPTINLDVDLRELNLEPFSPIGGDVINKIRGTVSGSADVTGSYKNPDFSGRLLLKNAGFAIPYLEVDYSLEDQAVVGLTQQQFLFEDLQITDTQYGTSGTLEGMITHENFEKWILGLNISTDRLLVLNTEAAEDALYYGTAFMGGNASIYGPTSELVIDVVGATERGTVFKIPIPETESIGDNSFIHFLTAEEKAARQAGAEIEIEEVKGLELNFDLDVTSDALVELDVDGSILRGRGAGTLLIEINTLGKFNMWGDFIANTGEYIFNYGALQKRFSVRPGGSINWSGSPTQADLNMSAVYEAYANPAIILENPAVSRRIPVNVVINLEGELIQPDISFDLEYPNVTSAVRSELEYKIETSANSEAQAFSLLALGQFYTPDVFGGNAGSAILGGVFQSASSGLFSSLVGDEEGVFEVGLNYEQGARTPEQTTADRFGVTLSTQISERVLINGQVGVPVGGVTETVIVGNIEIEFLLNEEGNLRAKIFNRENNIQYLGEELGFTQGVGISYQVDFDTFKELIQKIIDQELTIAKQEEDQEDQPKKESLAPDYINFPGVEQ